MQIISKMNEDNQDVYKRQLDVPTNLLDAELGHVNSDTYAFIIDHNNAIAWQSTSSLNEQIPEVTLFEKGKKMCIRDRIMTNQSGSRSVERLLMVCGLSALVLFVLIRGLNGYGNMFMSLEGNTLVQWLHVSKYPPSLAYTLLELGLMAIVFASGIVICANSRSWVQVP